MTDRPPAAQPARARRPRRTPALAALVVLALASAACTRSGPDAAQSDGRTQGTKVAVIDDGQPTKGGKVVIGVSAESDGWNPAYAQWADAGNIVGSSVFEPLFVYDKDANLVPWLAESAVPNANNTEWTITLRKGISFHDGKPMNADALVKSMQVATTEGLASIAIKSLFKDIVKVDEFSFKITTTVEWATFGGTLTTQTGLAVSPAMYETEDKLTDRPIGTGAFVFDSWEPDKSFKVKANERYWGGPCSLADPGVDAKRLCEQAGIPLGQKNGPHLEAIEFRPMPDENQRVTALRSGDVNLVFTNTAKNVSQAGDDFTVITDYNSEKAFLQLNTKRAPFDNAHARKALAHATNRTEISDAISPDEPLHADTSPFSQASKWGLPPDQTGYPAFDLAKAREEVEAYKRDTGQATLTFKMRGIATVDDQATLQKMQQQFTAAGIEAKIENIEQVALITTLVGGDFQSILIRNYAYPDPDSQYFFFSKASAEGPLFLNFSQYTSPEIEEALQVGRTSTDFAIRKEAYDKVARARNAAVTEVWLYDTPYALLANKAVRGLNPFRGLAWGNFIPKPFLTGIWQA